MKIRIVTPVPPGVPTQSQLLAARLGVEHHVTVLGDRGTSIGRLTHVVTKGVFRPEPVDVCIVDAYAAPAFYYLAAGFAGAHWLERVPTIWWLHGGDLPSYFSHSAWARLLMRQSSIRVAPSSFMSTSLAPMKIRVDRIIPNAIDLECYEYRVRTPVVPRLLYLRGTHPLYGPDIAIRTLNALQRDFPEASLTIAGREDTQSSRDCYELVRSLGVKHCNFIGLVAKQEIPTLVASHDIYLQCNRVDNTPVTLLEMWASGLPVVATSVGGIPHLVENGVDALTAPVDDYGALADCVRRLIADPTLAASLCERGRTRVNQYGWPRITALWNELLREVTAPRFLRSGQ